MARDFELYLKNMPVIPDVAARILAITEDKIDISFKELEDLIKMDPALTAKILRVANSALYARQREIKSLQMAITLLGFKNIKSLVLLVTASNTFSRFQKDVFYQFFWRHSTLSAFLARHIAVRCNRKEAEEDTFIAALLHDIGQVALYHAEPNRYQEVVSLLLEGKESVEKSEELIFSINHRQVGASLLEKWSFPDFYVDSAREHQSLNVTSSHKTLIMMVSVADLLAETIRLGALQPELQQLLAEIVRRTELSDADLQYYTTRYMTDLSRDPLFQECRSLFGLRD